jgi:hypothetical protein
MNTTLQITPRAVSEYHAETKCTWCDGCGNYGISTRERSYEEVMDAWRTSCPKLPVWEDANDRGLITTADVRGRSLVRITPSGRALLDQRKRLTR